MYSQEVALVEASVCRDGGTIAIRGFTYINNGNTINFDWSIGDACLTGDYE